MSSRGRSPAAPQCVSEQPLPPASCFRRRGSLPGSDGGGTSGEVGLCWTGRRPPAASFPAASPRPPPGPRLGRPARGPAEAAAQRSGLRARRLPAAPARGGGRGCSVHRSPPGGAAAPARPSPWASREAARRCDSADSGAGSSHLPAPINNDGASEGAAHELGARPGTGGNRTRATPSPPLPALPMPPTHSFGSGEAKNSRVLGEVAESVPPLASRSRVPTHTRARRRPPWRAQVAVCTGGHGVAPAACRGTRWEHRAWASPRATAVAYPSGSLVPAPS